LLSCKNLYTVDEKRQAMLEEYAPVRSLEAEMGPLMNGAFHPHPVTFPPTPSDTPLLRSLLPFDASQASASASFLMSANTPSSLSSLLSAFPHSSAFSEVTSNAH
jgi:hypothetical protein